MTPALARKMRPRADPDRGRARSSLDPLVRTLARPYRAASGVASRLRRVAVAVIHALAPAAEGGGAMPSRLVLLKERHEDLLRENRGGGAAEWLEIETRVSAMQRTPVARISPVEMDALMTAMDEWMRRRAR
jgi:hypothetical protein